MKNKILPHPFMVTVDGSKKDLPPGEKLATINTNECIEISVRVRRKKPITAALKKGKHISHEEYQAEFGSSPEDMNAVVAFASVNHLSVSLIDLARRTIMLKGKIKYFESAFQVHVANYRQADGVIFRGRTGTIKIPANLKSLVEGVFGLDSRPVAKPKFQYLKEKGFASVRAGQFEGYPGNEIANAYGFPNNVTGKGQCIGIIELGGGYRNKDLTSYFQSLNLPMPAVTAVAVGKGFNNPTTADSADGEVLLDIQVAGAVAPDAKIVVYFADNTDQGFLDAITTAVHDTVNKPSIISISWGGPEVSWTAQALNSYNEAFKASSLLGITICAAAGDQGSADQNAGDQNYDGLVHVDFPSSSPYVLACGGTRIKMKNGKIQSESVWHDAQDSATGGGVSEFFPIPDYQLKAAVPASLQNKFKGRGLPDVAGNASPESGYKVLVDGQWQVVGGTSAVAPLMAAFFALINEKNGKKAGFIQPVLYSKPDACCRDITVGDNSTARSSKGYKARKGWDACTGWGVMTKF